MPRRLVVGRLGRPHGLRGELTVEVRTDDADGRFVPGTDLATETDAGGSSVPATLRLTGARRLQGRWLLRFAGVADRAAAEALRGVRLLVDVADEPAGEDEWYVDELAGCEVVDVAGRRLGSLVRVDPGPAQDRLVVRPAAGGDDVLVPFVTALVPEVDPHRRRVVVDPPGGLFPPGDLDPANEAAP